MYLPARHYLWRTQTTNNTIIVVAPILTITYQRSTFTIVAANIFITIVGGRQIKAEKIWYFNIANECYVVFVSRALGMC